MKRLSILGSLTALCMLGACDEANPMTPKDGGGGSDTSTNPDGNMMNPDGGEAGVKCPADIDPNTAILEGSLTSDKTLLGRDSNGKECQYLLKGLYQVKAPATLTIQAGAMIKGDKNTKGILLVQKGAKIRAMGEVNSPVVFTSANSTDPKPGDWGGIVILGTAPVNSGTANVEGIVEGAMGADTAYGGMNPADSSGEMHYIRIEYPGIVLSNNNEVNGLTLGGVGSGTMLDHIQVRGALDDCFEFFGGTANAKYLACQSNEDDGFDFDFGYVGKLQFLVLQQSPTHDGEDMGFETDNDGTGTMAMPVTAPTVYNVTLCGKNADLPTALSYGFLLRRNVKGKYSNVVASGFDTGLDIRDSSTATNAMNGELDITSSMFFNMKASTAVENISPTESGQGNDNGFDEVAWFKTSAKKNSWNVDPMIPGCFDRNNPNFSPMASLTANAASPPNDGFFDTSAAYIGAFKDASDKWATTGKWVKWSDK